MSDQPTNTMISRTREEYQTLADQYDAAFYVTPYRSQLEQHSVLQAIQAVGGVAGRTVLDVACGTGHYTRLLRQQGATRAVGVDLSPEMIAVARHTEATRPLGAISYEVQDIGELDLPETFDLAVGVYLLHYATTAAHLWQMCQRIAQHIRPGGHLVTYVLNSTPCAIPDYYQKYGVNVMATSTLHDGDVYSFAVQTQNGWLPPITVYYWSQTALEQALQQAGFVDIRWQNPDVSPAGREQYGADYWQAYLDCPHCVLVTATKQ
jgi:2-polyprenyl-3-methyl-5-hydroxy-6-metoxy-1,4-benzoquinol methylase